MRLRHLLAVIEVIPQCVTLFTEGWKSVIEPCCVGC